MKDFGAPARSALAAGAALSLGAVIIDCAPDPVKIWGGYGELTIGDDVFIGVGDRGLVSVVAAALGASDQNITLELSGVDPSALSLFDMTALRRAPVVCFRLIYDPLGQTLLAAPVFARGRLDTAPKQETPGGDATITALVETAARGLGRGGGRMRTFPDQQMVDPDDDGMKSVTFAGQVQIYWGGKLPSTVQQAFNALTAGIGNNPEFSGLSNF